jgi:LysW-gamma-L-alpha-aminoadipyl-6-phosphate/LysW-L-glutamyl-5-phosphate reductase
VSVRVAVAGASGYIGGELLRLLLGHPRVELAAATSARRAGQLVAGAHPNLRGLTRLTFTAPDALPPCDVVFTAGGHAETMGRLAELTALAGQLVDLSADFRLRDPGAYGRYYGGPHAAPAELGSFTCGLPELYREELRTADRVAVPGCMATAAILAVHPLAAGELTEGQVLVDARTGSSGAGASAGPANQHAERSGAMRVFAPLSHRHEAEISQATGLPAVMTATGVEAVRGVQVICRTALRAGVGAAEVGAAYQRCYAAERFVRVLAGRRGQHRLPEPKILSGSNFCDVGFAVDDRSAAVVAVGALDNLVKGGAGNAVQCMNLRQGWPEALGLEFPGLHPN